MSTELHSKESSNSLPAYIAGLRIGIVVADWNPKITYALRDGAIETLKNIGYNQDDIDVYNVPGTVELTFASSQLVKSKSVDAVIAIGCVIRGDTPHFDYVCESATSGISHINATENIPVIFGVLTVENEQQALDRAGGVLGNKGSECAECAIKMCEFVLKLKK
ncbi:MAG: 6,7-dimethyl-8-ribityllumazine synthase [Muribaculaceae bacterium]|nr:6,7-dimethyl-8-ribityllumazine synthase [Muribaculaceae bacterium]